MNRKRTTALKVLLFIVPALILALVLQPASAVAEDTTFTVSYVMETDDLAFASAGFIDDDGCAVTDPCEFVSAGSSPQIVNSGGSGGGSFSPKVDGGYFGYWAANADVILNDGNTTTTVKSGDPLTTAQVKQIVVEDDLTITAYPWETAWFATFTFVSDGHGTVSKSSVDTYMPSSLGDITPTAIPDDDYSFDYWTADAPAYVYSSEQCLPPDEEGSGEWVAAGTHITADQMKRTSIRTNVTFTAHFKSTKATVTYKTDGHGTLDNSSESVNLDTTRELVDSTETLTVGRPTVGNDNPQPDAGYEFAYWTADKDVYVLFDGKLMREEAEHTTFQPEDIVKTLYVAEDTTYTAHFKRTAPCSVTYKSAGNGSVNPTSESVAVGSTPKGPTITPNTGFEFDYWTASAEVYFIDGQGNVTQFDVDDPISADEFVQLSIEDDITFTAHFKQTSVDPEPEPVNPDGGDTIKPADGEGGKLTPKTGDTLPGATAAVALGAGVVVAGAALLRKRCR